LRKAFSILLLLLFLFNVIGYYGVYLGLRYQSNRELKEKLDSEGYPEEDLLTLKLPFSLPYQMEWKGYERIDGEFEHDGEFYNLVKHKVERDTLYIVYLKDHKETSLFKTLVNFVQSTTDTPVSKKAQGFLENLIKDYIATTSSLQVSASGWSQDTFFPEPRHSWMSIDSPVFSPPPNLFF
jgi:hypothetical protein